MTGQLTRRVTALCIVLIALAAAACSTMPSSGGRQARHMERAPLDQAHFWGAMSEEPDAPPSQV